MFTQQLASREGEGDTGRKAGGQQSLGQTRLCAVGTVAGTARVAQAALGQPFR